MTSSALDRADPEGALAALLSHALAEVDRAGSTVEDLPESQRPSARNLVAYVAFRRHDLRRLQDELAQRGLSSLGRLEPHVVQTLWATLNAARCLTGGAVDAAPMPTGHPDFAEGRAQVDAHARLGQSGRRSRRQWNDRRRGLGHPA